MLFSSKKMASIIELEIPDIQNILAFFISNEWTFLLMRTWLLRFIKNRF